MPGTTSFGFLGVTGGGDLAGGSAWQTSSLPSKSSKPNWDSISMLHMGVGVGVGDKLEATDHGDSTWS